MKIPLIILIIFLLTSLITNAQVISLSINEKPLTILDSTHWQKYFSDELSPNAWRDKVLDSIDLDSEKVKTVKFFRNSNPNQAVSVKIYYLISTFSSNRVYKQEPLNFNIKDSTHILDSNIPFDMLFFDLQYGKQRFYSAVKFYSMSFQNKLEQELIYSFQQKHFFNDTINKNPCTEFILDGNMIKKDIGYYLLGDTIKIDLRLKRFDDLYCFHNLTFAKPNYLSKAKIKSIGLFIEGAVDISMLYAKYKRQIKALTKSPTKEQITNQPYLYIFKFLPKKTYKKIVTLEYIMQVSDKEAEVWIYVDFRTINFKINLAKQ